MAEASWLTEGKLTFKLLGLGGKGPSQMLEGGSKGNGTVMVEMVISHSVMSTNAAEPHLNRCSGALGYVS